MLPKRPHVTSDQLPPKEAPATSRYKIDLALNSSTYTEKPVSPRFVSTGDDKPVSPRFVSTTDKPVAPAEPVYRSFSQPPHPLELPPQEQSSHQPLKSPRNTPPENYRWKAVVNLIRRSMWLIAALLWAVVATILWFSMALMQGPSWLLAKSFHVTCRSMATFFFVLIVSLVLIQPSAPDLSQELASTLERVQKLQSLLNQANPDLLNNDEFHQKLRALLDEMSTKTVTDKIGSLVTVTDFQSQQNHLSSKFSQIEKDLELLRNRISEFVELDVMSRNEQLLNLIQEKAKHVVDTVLTEKVVTTVSEIQLTAARVDTRVNDLAREFKDVNQALANQLTKADIVKTVQSELDTFSADRLAIPDFALGSAGAKIVAVVPSQEEADAEFLELWASPSLTFSWVKLLKPFRDYWPQSLESKAPIIGKADNILNPGLNPGNCWAFPGNRGSVVVRLQCPVRITHVSLDHAHQKVLPNLGTSAPHLFRVFGISEYLPGSKPKKDLLVEATYKLSGPQVQTFPVGKHSQTEEYAVFKHVELEIISNHGALHTSIYRFRVHSVNGRCNYV